MGTTITVALFESGGSVVIGHVGDSRAYILRDGELEQLTEDHSLVAELVRRGELSPEQAEVHPQRSVITRALGTEPEVDVDAFIVPAKDGDIFLLCSDGLTTMVDSGAIAELLQANRFDLAAAARALIRAANDRGGEDNITTVLFSVSADDRDAPGEQGGKSTPPERRGRGHPPSRGRGAARRQLSRPRPRIRLPPVADAVGLTGADVHGPRARARRLRCRSAYRRPSMAGPRTQAPEGGAGRRASGAADVAAGEPGAMRPGGGGAADPGRDAAQRGHRGLARAARRADRRWSCCSSSRGFAL